MLKNYLKRRILAARVKHCLDSAKHEEAVAEQARRNAHRYRLEASSIKFKLEDLK